MNHTIAMMLFCVFFFGPQEDQPYQKEPTPIKGFTPAPAYPDSARRSGIQGMTWVNLLIDEKGNVKKAEVVKTDHVIFNQPSVLAAMKWKFEPAIINGKPVATWVVLPFKYKLSDDKRKPPAHPKSDGVRK